MAEFEVRGPQAPEALDFALVSHLSALPIGGACYTMACNESGGILDDLVVYRRSDHEYLVVANAANNTIVNELLTDRSQGFAAKVADVTDQYGLIAVQGPLARTMLQPFTSVPLDEIAYYASTPGVIHGVESLVARTGYTGEDGFDKLPLRVPPPTSSKRFLKPGSLTVLSLAD